MFFEHKALYRSVNADVPEGYYSLEFGQAATVREGSQATVVTYGMGVHWALDYAKQHPDTDLEIIDLRTLAPLDTDTVYASVRKTGRALVLHEDCLTGGIGGELSALITEHCFESLDAPVVRCASLDTPVPFAVPLENDFLATDRLAAKVEGLLNY